MLVSIMSELLSEALGSFGSISKKHIEGNEAMLVPEEKLG
jgi:hypothetical protein